MDISLHVIESWIPTYPTVYALSRTIAMTFLAPKYAYPFA